MAAIELKLNGRTAKVDVDPAMPLLWVLRDRLGLTGAKYGCGVGACGACTVLVDGVATRSCQITAGELAGRAITTIEGLAPAGGLHAVQRAWLEEDVAQCGYCQPAAIITTAALLRTKPRPSDAEIDEAFAGFVCRCGSYPRMRRAIRRAANGGKAAGGAP